MKKILLLSMLFIASFSCDDNLSFDSDEAAKGKSPKAEVSAGDEWSEWTDNVPDPCKQVCLVAGQHMYVGTVDVAEVNDGLLVTYNVTEPGVYLEEVHLDIFNNEDDFKDAKKVSNGGAIPGKFEYKESWSADAMITSHSVLIPTSYIDEYIDDVNCIFIASHAALSNGETAWGGLCDSSSGDVTDLDSANQFGGANWSVYFQFCLDECVENIDFTYAWEDLENAGNDGDYNDLVIQADIIKSAVELKVTFLASARGASYDHQFKIKVPSAGILGVYGEASVVEVGGFHYITVFASTKTELPQENISPHQFAANTVADDDTCEPMGTAEITLSIDNSFIYDPSKPYEPFITVYPSGTAGVGDNHDLYIWEISKDDRPIGEDVWEDKNGDVFPNGIIIPRDWKWPLEREIISGPYPDFMPIATWDANWADNLADPSLIFDCD